jgi:hypothetical protein
MIGKPAKSFAAVNYNGKKVDKKKTAKLIHFENFGYLQDREIISSKEFKNYLEKYSARNSFIKKPQFHGILSSKGRLHNFEELKKAALEMMFQLGYEGNPILIYEHNDTGNNHVHIVSSRVDIYGNKIKDSHEKRRAMSILNKIQEIKPELEWERDLEKVFTYSVETVAQSLLLFELRGYQVKNIEDGYEFYKYGKLQGKVLEARLADLIKAENIERNKGKLKMRAIIQKYLLQYNGELKKRDDLTKVSDKEEFRSGLTEFLSKRFGWEFVFFVAKGKDFPYGYAVIDHKSRMVHKGSEIMKLSEMVQGHHNTVLAQNNSTIQTIGAISLKRDVDHLPTNNTDKPMESTIQNSESVVTNTGSEERTVLSNLIDEQIYRLDIDSKEDARQRRRRKRGL